MRRLGVVLPQFPPVPTDSSWHTAADKFLNVVDPEPVDLVSDLVQEGVLMLVHGEPRAMKSYQSLEIALALTTQTPAFNLPRFSVPKAVPVMYISQEDPARLVRKRLKLLLQGRALLYNRPFPYPKLLHVSCQNDLNLDNEAWCTTLAHELKTLGIKLLILDPIRRFSSNVDQGPGEVAVLTTRLRKICSASGTTIMIVHHDVKPGREQDDRRLGHRASGGDWFAACECPVHCHVISMNPKIVKATGQDYKHSMDPDPFTYELVTDDPNAPTYFQVQGTEIVQATPEGLEELVAAFLANHPGKSLTNLRDLMKVNKNKLVKALKNLEKTGKATWLPGLNRSRLWSLVPPPEPSGSIGSH